ncbi:MAG: hypothetical protein NZ571_14385, partial [Anaerolineae bacterium]|nr:hypothetical protein [Anaerolineae bacterium]
MTKLGKTPRTKLQYTTMRQTIPVTAYLLILSVILLALFAPVFSNVVVQYLDYRDHYIFALKFEEGKSLRVPHVLYHVLAILLGGITGAESHVEVSVALATLFKILQGATLFLAVRLQVPSSFPSLLILIIVVAFLLTTPLYVWFDLPFFLGYVNYLTYFSPTQNLSLIFALPAFLIALRSVLPQPYGNTNQRFVLVLFSLSLMLLLS